jgi:hypothetical protein
MKSALIILVLAASCLAAPAPPEIIVNNATMECSMFNAGDECTRCEIPDGWVSLGRGTVSCPEGYADISAARNCTPGRNARCCSEGHSGAMGDCGTVIVNDNAKACAFSDDYACQNGIASGWKNASSGSGQCPSGYGWETGPCENQGGCAAPAAMLMALIALTFVKK